MGGYRETQDNGDIQYGNHEQWLRTNGYMDAGLPMYYGRRLTSGYMDALLTIGVLGIAIGIIGILAWKSHPVLGVLGVILVFLGGASLITWIAVKALRH